MKYRGKSILGVALTMVLMVSLLAWSAPVSAGNTLQWDEEDIPGELGGNQPSDIAVFEGGRVVYVVDDTTTLSISTDKGVSWETSTMEIEADFVAVSPDDPKYIAVADATKVYISDDGGATFKSLGDVVNAGFAIYDIAVSIGDDGDHYVAVAGDGTGTINYATGGAEVWYYEIGAIGAKWTEISADTSTGWENGEMARAVAFSPAFSSDEILVAVTGNAAAGPIYLQAFSFNAKAWNEKIGGFDSGYPVKLVAAATLESASIAMSPDYYGEDDDLRQIFVGITTDGTEATDADGIFFCDDDSVEALKQKTRIHSIDFDGTNLVAGEYGGTKVWRSDNPLKGEDADVDGVAAKKAPGGEKLTKVAFAGSGTVVAITQGNESGFSLSHNLGKSFNDISMIDTLLTDMLDVAVSADGSVVYLLTADDIVAGKGDLSLWRMSEDQDADWERVLSLQGESGAIDFIIRIAPDDPDVVYLARTGDKQIYLSTDAGETNWRNRTSKEPVVDLAVETTGEVLYVLTTYGFVSKSTNIGFTWEGKETTGQGGSGMIVSLGENLVLVGGDSNTPAVSYSRDGNESWTDLDELDAGLVQVTASGLSAGDFIYAATDEEADIYRWEIGDGEWDDIGVITTDYGATGIALDGKILYVLAKEANIGSTVFRTIDATADAPTFKAVVSKAGVVFDAAPSALRMSSGSNVLWAIDTTTGPKLYSLEDTLTTAVPVLRTPSDGFAVKVNPVSGDINNVSLSWESPSDEVTKFNLDIAFDSGFKEKLALGVLPGLEKTAGCWDEGNVIVHSVAGGDLTPDTTYFWRVRVDSPFRSGWAKASFTTAKAEATPPVIVQPAPPAPQITIEVPPAPTVTLPAPVVQLPEMGPAIPSGLLWAVVVIGAILVIALIVLIVRTRKVA